MHPSVNYDFVIHGDHIHWCNVEAQGISRCEAQAIREHSAAANTDPIAEVSVSMLIAMGITMVVGTAWGLRQRGRLLGLTDAGASIPSLPRETGA